MVSCYDILNFTHCFLLWYCVLHTLLIVMILWTSHTVSCYDIVNFTHCLLLWYCELQTLFLVVILWTSHRVSCYDIVNFTHCFLLWYCELHIRFLVMILWTSHTVSCYDIVNFTHCFLLWYFDRLKILIQRWIGPMAKWFPHITNCWHIFSTDLSHFLWNALLYLLCGTVRPVCHPKICLKINK